PTRISRRLDHEDPEPGFADMPDEVLNVFGWTPGKAPFIEANEISSPLDRGTDLVVQLHMLPTGKPEVIQPSVGIFLTPTPPARPPLLIKMESKTIDIP